MSGLKPRIGQGRITDDMLLSAQRRSVGAADPFTPNQAAYTADENTGHNSLTGTIRQLFGLLFKRLRLMQGTASSLDAVPITLQQTYGHTQQAATGSTLGHVKTSSQVALDGSNAMTTPDDQSAQRVQVRQSGALVGTRRAINVIAGSAVSTTMTDDSGNNRVNVTVTVNYDNASLGLDGLGKLTILANGVANAQFRQSVALSVVGRASNSTGSVADIMASSNDTVLVRQANSLMFAQVTTDMLADESVSYPKLPPISSGGRGLGRYSAGPGPTEPFDFGDGLVFAGSNLTANLGAGLAFVAGAIATTDAVSVRTVADADISVTTADRIVQYTSLTTTRTATLPLASAMTGQFILFKDASGSASGSTKITISRSGSALIDGATSIDVDTAYGTRMLYCDGVNYYIC